MGKNFNNLVVDLCLEISREASARVITHYAMDGTHVRIRKHFGVAYTNYLWCRQTALENYNKKLMGKKF